MATKRKRNKRPSQDQILNAIAHYPRVRYCDGCGTSKLTINQGAAASPTMRNGRILCADCRNRILPILLLRLQVDCEADNCGLKSQELHQCGQCGVHLLCTRHHRLLHFLKDAHELQDDFEFRWAACLSGTDLCGRCSRPAEVTCECPSGYTHLFCHGHHQESCPYLITPSAGESLLSRGPGKKSFTGEVWQTRQAIDEGNRG